MVHSIHNKNSTLRAQFEGIEALGDEELLALVLGNSATSRRLAALLLEELGGLGGLARQGLGGATGIHETRRVKLEAAMELGRRTSQQSSLPTSFLFENPERVAAWGQSKLGHLIHEELWMLAMDGRHRLIAARRLGQGGSHGCAVKIRDILRLALRLGAASFVLIHNHPSGDPTPSQEDIHMSQEVSQAAKIVGLSLLDHLILGAEQHVSLFASGVLCG